MPSKRCLICHGFSPSFVKKCITARYSIFHKSVIIISTGCLNAEFSRNVNPTYSKIALKVANMLTNHIPPPNNFFYLVKYVGPGIYGTPYVYTSATFVLFDGMYLVKLGTYLLF